MNQLKSFLRPLWNSPLIYWLRSKYFDFSEILTGYRIEKKRFFESTGYEPNFDNPKTFSEHLVWKKIHDRRKVLTIVSDKYRVREHVKEVLGEDEANKVLVPLLYSGSDPDMIPFDSFSGEYIVKANHNSGPNFIVGKNAPLDRDKIVSSLKEQLARPYGTLKHEWAYGQIKKRLVVVEKLLRDETGNLPRDYKFHMVNGQCVFIQIDFDRFIDHSRTLYDKGWNYIKGTLKFKQGPESPRPKNFEYMLSLAERLSKTFDYIRIDLYNVDGNIYLGEMTNYPGSGIEKFTPISLDLEMGKYWEENE
ncbi:MAG: ATP-grasp fold amidoligase family protein [Minisyncoccia bacterium]